jgi:UDP-glucose 4-epimerase
MVITLCNWQNHCGHRLILNNMKILIFGAKGYLGNSLFKKFELSGVEIEIVIRGETNFFQNRSNVEISSLESFLSSPGKNDADVCYFCFSTLTPALAEKGIEQTLISDNLMLSQVLGKLKQGCRFVYISSGGTIYGEMSDEIACAEESMTKPINQYGVYKLQVEKFLESQSRMFDLSIYVIRLSNPYGPWPSGKAPFGFINRTIELGINGQAVEIFGSDQVVRDFVFISDVVEALFELGKCHLAQFKILNLGSGIGSSLLRVIEVIQTHIPLRISMKSSRGFDVHKNVLDIRRIHSELKWQPKIDLVTGILKTIESKKKPDDCSNKLLRHKPVKR